MRKEVIIVILVGVAIGAIVAFGIYTAQSAIDQQSAADTQDQTTEVPDSQPTPTEEHSLSINQPADESISDQEEITIAGSTTPESVITILTPENEYLLTADSQGNFSSEIELAGGANSITVTAFDELGNRAESILTVVYSTEL